jgi:hypothetical protein
MEMTTDRREWKKNYGVPPLLRNKVMMVMKTQILTDNKNNNKEESFS